MRLIDADKFKEDLMKLWDYSCVDGVTATDVLKQVIHDLDNAPTIILCSETSEGYPLMDLRPREKGEWIKIDHRTYKCPVCNNTIFIHGHDELSDYKFCNGCGADMRGENNGNT